LLWLSVSCLFLLLICAAGFIIWLRYRPERPLEITLPPPTSVAGSVILSGGVANPGIYPFYAGDTIESLIQTAGGCVAGANLSNVNLSIPLSVGNDSQKIDINHAEPWLLEALPGIGPTLAQRISAYRQQNGLFHSTSDLLQVDGMGEKTLQQIQNMITVGD
jgi:competence protein ComEA